MFRFIDRIVDDEWVLVFVIVALVVGFIVLLVS
jgi:hypothetical protein